MRTLEEIDELISLARDYCALRVRATAMKENFEALCELAKLDARIELLKAQPAADNRTGKRSTLRTLSIERTRHDRRKPVARR